MRDDIHNKAPISAALRAVLKRALRPADRANPKMLREAAVRALCKDMGSGLTPGLIDALVKEEQKPGLFGRASVSAPTASRLQADLLDHLGARPNSTVKQAVEAAGHASINSICNETEAALIAAGGGRKQVRIGVDAFKSALTSAVSEAVELIVAKRKAEAPDHRVRLTESLALGPRAQSAAQ